jgi:hypothetical protein
LQPLIAASEIHNPQALEELLASHRVQRLVLPSIKALLPMWQGKFRFVPFTVQEQKVGSGL